MRLPLKITHVSDTHGTFPKLRTPDMVGDVIVHSGDLLPNPPDELYHAPNGSWVKVHPDSTKQVAFQEQWVRQKALKFIGWAKDAPLLFCPGNHDYFDLVPMLQRIGVNAIDINEKFVRVKGYSFYGFPWVPLDCIPWNYCLGVPEMQERLNHASRVIDENGGELDVLVVHCPPAGVLDMARENRYGNSPLNDFLNYKLIIPPKLILCGHVHQNNGMANAFNSTVSNAATVVHHLELHDDPNT